MDFPRADVTIHNPWFWPFPFHTKHANITFFLATSNTAIHFATYKTWSKSSFHFHHRFSCTRGRGAKAELHPRTSHQFITGPHRDKQPLIVRSRRTWRAPMQTDAGRTLHMEAWESNPWPCCEATDCQKPIRNVKILFLPTVQCIIRSVGLIFKTTACNPTILRTLMYIGHSNKSASDKWSQVSFKSWSIRRIPHIKYSLGTQSLASDSGSSFQAVQTARHHKTLKR